MNQAEEKQPKTRYLAIYKVYHPDFPTLELYGGQHLGKWGYGGPTDKIEELLDFGIVNSICLIQDYELSLYSNYNEDALKINPNFKLFHYPIVDMSVPTKALMVEILDKMDELIAANEKIYVHCLGGHGRTGTVIGCWLKRHGFEQGNIYRKLALWRKETLFGTSMSSPQRAEQFAMINNWQKGE